MFKEHTWARKDDDSIVVGISDYVQDQLSEIIFVELPELGDSFVENEAFGNVESVKASSELYMPLNGTVLEVNIELEEAPESANS